MRALANRLNRGFRRTDKPHDLAVFDLGMIAHQPEDGVGPILTTRYRCVARALLFLRLWKSDLGIEQLEPVVRIGDAFLDLFAAELAGEYGIEPLDALRRIAIGDSLHLERMKLAKIGDLIKRERGVLDQPDGGCFRHQRCGGHV